ncbi:transcriptional regulator [Natronococcus jeotgali DSM 18795]|uniref:Transcriptional regulator n=2 Tax=Natronococcus jeotgali TaxID=413812 RepID=L9Y0L3_9EURY|nr:transcriptional regulator [Natronococcus jeotgali DSM 18795]
MSPMSDSKQSERSVPIGKIKDRRESLLSALELAGGEATTPTLRENGDVPRGSINYHLELLEEWGAIMRVGSEQVGGGEKAVVWAITDEGRDALEEIRERDESPPSASELEGRADLLEARVKRLEATFNKFAYVVNQHEEELDVVDSGELEEFDEELERLNEEVDRLEEEI